MNSQLRFGADLKIKFMGNARKMIHTGHEENEMNMVQPLQIRILETL